MSKLLCAHVNKLRPFQLESGFGYLFSGILPKKDCIKWYELQNIDDIRLDWAKKLQAFVLELNSSLYCFKNSDWTDFLNSHESDDGDDWVRYSILNEPERVVNKTDDFRKKAWGRDKQWCALHCSTLLSNEELSGIEIWLSSRKGGFNLSFDKLFDSATHRINNAYSLEYKDFILLFDVMVKHFHSPFINLSDRDYIQNIVISNAGSEIHEFKAFPHREAGGWMVYVAAQVTKEQIPAAHEIIRLSNGGSLIISQPEFFSAFEEEHVKRANLIEVQLNELGLLPETLEGLDELEGVKKGWVKPITKE